MALTHRDAPYPHWEFEHPGSGDRLRLVPERGGLISGWCVRDQELLYLDVDRFADPTLSVRGGIPVLFPICGGLPGDLLPLPQGSFALPQHGFARDQAWRLEPLADGSGVVMALEESPQTLLAYPFHFRLRLEARLLSGALEITVQVQHPGNLHAASASIGSAEPSPEQSDKQPASGPIMPFSFGLHPYFNVSALANVSVEGVPPEGFDHRSMAPVATASELQRLETGVDLLTRPAGAVRLLDHGNGRAIELQPSHPWDLVVLWSDPPRPMVCLEPWTGPRQALLSGDRRLDLAPGEAITLRSRFVLIQPPV